MSDTKDIATIEAAITAHNNELKSFIVKANEEIKIAGSTAAETKNALDKISEKAKETVDRLMDVEQKIARRPGAGGEDFQEKSAGRLMIDSPEFKAAVDGKRFNVEPVNVGSFHKTAIFNATGLNQPLVPTDRISGLITPQLRRMTIRDLLPKGTTTSNMIQFAKENVFTNNAGPQFEASPTLTEGAIKPESGITFTIANEPVITVAHWIPASRQVLADAPMLQSYIDTRLLYGLKLEEEDELLNGVTANGELNGLLPQATAYNRSASADTKLDAIRRSLTQLQIAEFEGSGIVMSPSDWEAIELLKETTGGYIWANPMAQGGPRLWGLPVVVTNAMTTGTFLVGAFNVAAQIWDREDASIRVAEQHADFFIKNMVAILAEERLALTVYRPLSFIKGSF